ncbi:MAG TPA: hypothetical protein P5293_00410 [Bacteroidales bacterium]|nr:hypothetical protein [Bacteroidales bacterium]
MKKIDEKIEKYLIKKMPTDPFVKHQIAMARKTLKMNDVMARIMGGMTKEQARAILKKYGLKEEMKFGKYLNDKENISE